MPMEKRDYTTGDVARLLKISQQSVVRMCNDGELKHYHHPGRGRFRRITRESLIAFVAERGMPLPDELREGAKDV